jgi:hypothetical protein
MEETSKNNETAQLGIGAVSNSALNQSEIVKQRLNYHFSDGDGNWNVPKSMPFMKEFLNEVYKLCESVS